MNLLNAGPRPLHAIEVFPSPLRLVARAQYSYHSAALRFFFTASLQQLCLPPPLSPCTFNARPFPICHSPTYPPRPHSLSSLPLDPPFDTLVAFARLDQQRTRPDIVEEPSSGEKARRQTPTEQKSRAAKTLMLAATNVCMQLRRLKFPPPRPRSWTARNHLWGTTKPSSRNNGVTINV